MAEADPQWSESPDLGPEQYVADLLRHLLRPQGHYLISSHSDRWKGRSQRGILRCFPQSALQRTHLRTLVETILSDVQHRGHFHDSRVEK